MSKRWKAVLIVVLIITGAFLVFSRAENETSNELYDVLKDAATEGTYAQEYTGEHQDTLDNSGNEPIYYWRENTQQTASIVLNKNNVKLGDTCWQMLRTTDTGGVKLIYNGKYHPTYKCDVSRSTDKGVIGTFGTTKNLNGSYQYGDSYAYNESTGIFTLTNPTTATWSDSTYQNLIGKYTCANSSSTCTTLYYVGPYNNSTTAYTASYTIGDTHYSQIGKSAFNTSSYSPAMLGYMFNNYYPRKENSNREQVLSSSSLNTSYWYADSVTWGSPTADKFNLDNPYQVSSTSDYPSLVGKYTFKNTSQTYTGTNVYYIAAVNGSSMYYIQLFHSTNNSLGGFNVTYTYGDSYRDNGDGTYTITNQNETQPATIERKDWYSNYSNVQNKYVCKNATNNTCSDLWYAGYTYSTGMDYTSIRQNNYKYANGFEYRLDPDDNTYKYFLNNDSVTLWNLNDTNKTSLNTHHYTCWNETGKCSTLSYIYYLNGTIPNYIDLTGGKSVEDAKNEMLYNNGVNRYNSSMKGYIEAWYHQNMVNYTDYLEDVIYCNNRAEDNPSTNGWNPNGGNTSTFMTFNSLDTPVLKCNNVTDQFTTTNAKAALRYPVGLATASEMALLDNSITRKTGQDYCLLSPDIINNYTSFYSISSAGGFSNGVPNYSQGVRPVISLKPGTKYTTGNGSMNNPYVIEEMPKITTSVTNGTITETSRVESGTDKTIKYKPNSGYVIDSILVDGIAVSTSDYKSRYTFTNVTTDHTIDVVYRQGTTADFDWGERVNAKMKNLANNSTVMSYSTPDTVIKAVKRATSLPTGFTSSTENTISTSDSPYPIYIFFDDTDGTMYYYSEAEIVYLNSFSYRLFGHFQGLEDISGLSEVDTSKVTNIGSMFYGCSALTNIDSLSDWDTSNVTSTEFMFRDCKMTNIDALSNWDISKVTNMADMFYNCDLLEDIDGASSWDTSRVTNMGSMFNGCSALTNIDGASNWDTSKVTRMDSMFYTCRLLKNIDGASNWDTSRVTRMDKMFDTCRSLEDIDGASDWDTSNVTKMERMFYSCHALTNIDGASDWDISGITDMSDILYDCISLLNIDGASSWDTSNVTTMEGMFNGCSSLENIDGASNWDTSKVTTMKNLFYGCSSLEDIDGASNWDTSNVINISKIFRDCRKASGIFPILGNPTSYDDAFLYASRESGSQITVIYNCVKTTNIDAIIATKSSDSNVVKGSCITTSATFDTGNNVTVKMKNLANNSSSMTPSSTDTTIQAIKKASSLPNGFTPTAENTISSSTSEKPIYIYFDSTDGTMYYYSEADTLYLNEDCSNMFNGFRSLTDISGLADVDASEVTNINSFFALCRNLTDIDDLSDWDTSNITNMSSMFIGCSSLENIDGASDWDTSSVTNMSNMFNGCTLLEDINGASNWDTSNVTNTSIMFSNCPKASGTFPILGNPTTYYGMFSDSATDTGSQITVVYNCTETTNIDAIIATKSSTSNVVKGSCILTNVDVTVTNEVYGNMASVNKEFSYTVTVRDNNDVVVPELGTTFTLKNDESEVLSIPVGYSITVTQDSETGYETTVNDTNSRTITKTITDDETITYKNTYNISPATGTVTILTPYILLLIFSILTTFGIV
ncbi:MAG: BspA family leucine-rich repeat surface protein, partial [Bacilli bacterium]|nr:BspA family leucine-rich repeat surface protein [Bacilli bacterium]